MSIFLGVSMRHTDRHGWGEGGGGEANTNDALMFSGDIEM